MLIIMQPKNTKLLNAILGVLLAFQGLTLFENKSSSHLAMDRDFEDAITFLSKHGPRTITPTYRVLAEGQMFSSFSPAQAHLNFADKSCAIAVKQHIADDAFMKTITETTKWSMKTAALFVMAHETQHCEDFAKLNQILHGATVPFSDEVLTGLLPRDMKPLALMKTSDPWGNYIKISNDARAQRFAEASSDLAALIAVHKAHGLAVRDVRELAKLRTDETQPGYDWQHDTAPWLRAFAAYLGDNNKAKALTGNDILKSMDAAQTSRFIYQFLNMHQV